MFEWKVEDMKIINGDVKYNLSSTEEMIEAVDTMYENKMTELIKVIEKFREDLNNGFIKTDGRKYPKTSSLKAWLNKNDKNLFFTVDYQPGSCRFKYCNGKFNICAISLTVDLIVRMCYEKLLEELKAKETKYFKDHDEYTICKRELKDNIDTYGTIGFNATFSSSIGLMLGTF